MVVSIKEETKGSFQLLNKNKKLTIAGSQLFLIPFSFNPKEISQYFANIVVFFNDKIEWKYPIKGVTEYISNSVAYSFKTKARKQLQEELRISLTVG